MGSEKPSEWAMNAARNWLTIWLRAGYWSTTDVMMAHALDEAARPMVAEIARLRAALEAIQQWDMISPPDRDKLEDGPWLKRLVDAALSPPQASGEEPTGGD